MLDSAALTGSFILILTHWVLGVIISLMIAAFDTYHFDNGSRTGVVLFEDWTDGVAAKKEVCRLAGSTDQYITGEFYKRELPCIMVALASLEDKIETIVVDSYVQLAPGQPGLGQMLFEALDEKVAVVGVAKTRFQTATEAIEIYRGKSTRPLFVSAAAMEVGVAADHVKAMHGNFRMPTLLKLADSLSRGDVSKTASGS